MKINILIAFLLSGLIIADNCTDCLADVNAGEPCFWSLDLSYCDFSNMDLENAGFDFLNLYGANFSGSNLSGASFSGATLTNADFTNADVSSVFFYGASLVGANFFEGTCTSANFYNANLDTACMVDCAGFWGHNGHNGEPFDSAGEFAPGWEEACGVEGGGGDLGNSDCSFSGGCTDTDSGSTDMFGQDCSEYEEWDCDGWLDDDDFMASSMCCICGGGETADDFDCEGLIVTMEDDYGDGWNGNVLTIGDQTFTLASGDFCQECYIGPEDVVVTCNGGTYQDEVSWSIGNSLSGGAPYEGCLGDCSGPSTEDDDTATPETSFIDLNEDGYDDTSFAAGVASVDANNDGLVDAFPTLSIINGSATVLIQGTLDEYIDSGASCSDQEDGNISQNVEVSGQVVNMNIPGTYTVSYDCSDSDGNAAQTKSRTVFVIGSLIADENGDGFDDDAFLAGAQSGDISGNGTLNITDIIMYIELIINAD